VPDVRLWLKADILGYAGLCPLSGQSGHPKLSGFMSAFGGKADILGTCL